MLAPFDRNQPYNDLPLLPPTIELETKAVLKQAQTLATLRDTLLPRLISGQLRLPEAEALIEEANTR